MAKIRLSHIAALVSILFLVFVVYKNQHIWQGGDYEPRVESSGITLPINMLITNSMNDLEQTKTFDREVENFMRRWDITGASFALMRNDSLIYAKGYGYADLDNDITCEVNNVFRIASVSKLITATAIMKLVEQKKLSLSAKVFGERGILNDSIFLNINDRRLSNITVEHLLRHTAGFSSPIGDPAFNNEGVARVLKKQLPLSDDDMILYATRNRLRSNPGSSYNYSNLGYIVLGKVIEKVVHLPYVDYVQDSVLFPAGCYDIHMGQSFSRDKRLNEVNYYEVKEAEKVEASDGSDSTMRSDGGNNITLLGAAGGWVASPVELLRFVASINGDNIKRDILSLQSIKTMTYDSKRLKPIGWASVRGEEWTRTGSMAGTSAIIKQQKNGYTWAFVANKSSWVGYNFNNYVSTQITRSLAKVKSWPARDMFIVSDTLTFSSLK
ncbi:MAG: serine hydrolase domain-containing protein [Rikenellaceae bacterium]